MLSNLNRGLLKQGVLFFLYGAAVNLGIGILVLRRSGDSSILSLSFGSLIVALVAGVAFGLWMVAFLRGAANEAGGRGWGVIAGAGLRGVLSTALAMVVLSIFEAVALTERQHSNPHGPGGLSFIFILMGTATYGMGRLLVTVPIGFASGAIAGIYLRTVTRRSENRSYEVASRGVPRKSPLIWSAVGLLFILVPIIGTACSTVGLVQGALDLRGWRREDQGTRTVPLAAVVMGSLGLIWFLLSVFVYVMAGHGWFRAS